MKATFKDAKEHDGLQEKILNIFSLNFWRCSQTVTSKLD